MDGDDLSEGEIVSSSEEDAAGSRKRPLEEGEEKEREGVSLLTGDVDQLIKRRKEQLRGGGGGGGGGGGSTKRRKEKKKHKKQLYKKGRKGSFASQDDKKKTAKPSSHACIKQAASEDEIELLKELTKLLSCSDPSSSSPSTTAMPCLKFKTKSFKRAIRYLLLRDHALQVEWAGLEELAKKQVVVVWLSQVSAEMFYRSEEWFKRIKALPACVRFYIENPGSARYAQLGLEAFMQGEEEEEQERVTMECVRKEGEEFTRAHCLLSEAGLRENGFPVPYDVCKDVSGYTSMTEWPQHQLSHGEIGTYPIFAVDCEMVATVSGLELARVSIVNESLECVYDSLVQPHSTITDYLTRYSGITEELLREVSTTLKDAQEDIQRLLPKKSILLGHSLENDLHALQLLHPYVIDTSCLFTPTATPLSKPSLRMLTKKLLDKDIQGSEKGHNSIEDASACMRLVQLKLKNGPSCLLPWTNKSKSLINELSLNNLKTAIVDKTSVVSLFGSNATQKFIVDNDRDAIEKAREAIPNSDFVFVQLHAVEQCLRREEGEEGLHRVVENMDEQVAGMVEGARCGPGTLVMVVCGSSCIKEVKRLQQQPIVNLPLLKREVMVARTGVVSAFMTS